MKRTIISIVTVVVMAFTVFAITPDHASAASGKYWLKVNVERNVVNVYKKIDGDWEPYRVMLCSCGKSSTPTPIGTYSVKKKWRWIQFNACAGQYVTQFNGNYLFHSDIYSTYGKPGTCIRSAYNKLGKGASHGCVRLATMDAKWIYQNCGWGTKVTTYKSSKSGPLGKPKKVPMAGSGKVGWDPTDNIKSNKKFKMTGPVIKVKKSATVEYGAKFKVKSGVTAKSPYTFQNLTSSVRVAKVKYRPDTSVPYTVLSEKKVDTTVPGIYVIKYACYDKYCGPQKVKIFKLVVNPKPEPEEPSTEPTDPSETTDPTDANNSNLGDPNSTDPTGNGVTDPSGAVDPTSPTQ